MIIAIDGPAGAGKSTVARLLAKELNFLYLDTGAMYRAITLKAINNNIDVKNQGSIIEIAKDSDIQLENNPDGSIKLLLDGIDVSKDIRHPRVTRHVSDVAKIKEVRQIMLSLQRKLGKMSDSVLDGRDIGTVVFPDADKKFYIDADFSERSMRRYKELKQMGQQIALEDVESDLRNRDHIDSNREVAPLKKADDAIYIDTTNMSIADVVSTMLKYTVKPA